MIIVRKYPGIYSHSKQYVSIQKLLPNLLFFITGNSANFKYGITDKEIQRTDND